MRKSLVYKFYNKEKELLYVGITDNFKQRLKGHKHDKDWFSEIKEMYTSEHLTRSEARIYEIYFVSNENPKYNKALSDGDRADESYVQVKDIEFKLYEKDHKKTENLEYWDAIATIRYNIDSLKYMECEWQCPIATNNIENFNKTMIEINGLARFFLWDNNKENDGFLIGRNMDEHVLFGLYIETLCRRTNTDIKFKNRILKNLDILAYHKFIKKRGKYELPTKYLGRYREDMLWFSIPSFTFHLYPKIEERAIKWKENGYTAENISYQTLLNCEGIEIAEEIYPEFKKEQ